MAGSDRSFARRWGAAVLFLLTACGTSSGDVSATAAGASAGGEPLAGTAGARFDGVAGRAEGGTGGASSGAASGAVGGSLAGGSDLGGGGTSAGAGAHAGGGAGGGGGDEIIAPTGYELVWHDEFDVDGVPNPANWKFEQGLARNEEAQWYQADNARVLDGLLVIEARKERVKNPQYTGSGDWKTSREYAEYTSSSLMTRGLQSFQFGRFEMRARIPTAAGMWPAWWTLGVSGEWPSNGEIDIMEFYQGKVLANVACGTSTRWQAKWDSETKSLASLGAGWASEFHVWRMDWDAQKIELYLDDQLLNLATLASMLNADGRSPFEQKAYLLLNLALGGINGGDPSKTPFPQRYEVDYVRVFQRPTTATR
jgi:beta-glucanase (GH16 family)